MQTITIKAKDTLFFRDGKPFSMGGETFAQGLFPPPPSVIYGAIRSTYIARQLSRGVSLSDAIEKSEALYIHSFGLKIGSDRQMACPKDLIVPNTKKYETRELHLIEAPSNSNNKTPYTLKSKISEKTVNGLFLMDALNIEDYIAGNPGNLPVQKLSEFMISEPKVGIARNPHSHAAAEGRLYRMQFNRLSGKGKREINDLSFEIGFEGIELSEKGWLTLGSDRRIASYETTDAIYPKRVKLDSARFKIYLSTPAVFKEGWIPQAFLKENDLELLTAAIGKPLSIGGWDIKKKRPKPMIKAVPEGSVYYVEAESAEKAQQTVDKINGKSISDNLNGINYKKQGFGIAYAAKV